MQVLAEQHDLQDKKVILPKKAEHHCFDRYTLLPASLDPYDNTDAIFDECLNLMVTTGIKDILKLNLFDLLTLDPYHFRKVKLFVNKTEELIAKKAAEDAAERERKNARNNPRSYHAKKR